MLHTAPVPGLGRWSLTALGWVVLLVLALAVLLVATALVVVGRRQAPAAAGTAATVLGMVLAVLGVALVLIERLPSVQALALGMFAVTAVLGIAGTAYAVYLWLRHARPPTSEHQLNLSVALGTGASLALLLAGLQLLFVLQSERQRVENDRESIRLAVAMAPDLTGFRLPRDPGDRRRDLPLSDYWFRGKKMSNAFLERADVRGADFAFADLSGANLHEARLDEPDGGGRTNFRGATLRSADLRGARLAGANLTEADLRKAQVDGADFSGALLDWADLRDLDCGPDGNHPRPCGRQDLRRLGLPELGTAPPTACLLTQEPEGRREECGAFARLTVERRR